MKNHALVLGSVLLLGLSANALEKRINLPSETLGVEIIQVRKAQGAKIVGYREVTDRDDGVESNKVVNEYAYWDRLEVVLEYTAPSNSRDLDSADLGISNAGSTFTKTQAVPVEFSQLSASAKSFLAQKMGNKSRIGAKEAQQVFSLKSLGTVKRNVKTYRSDSQYDSVKETWVRNSEKAIHTGSYSQTLQSFSLSDK